jgi:hypothetical protein
MKKLKLFLRLCLLSILTLSVSAQWMDNVTCFRAYVMEYQNNSGSHTCIYSRTCYLMGEQVSKTYSYESC